MSGQWRECRVQYAPVAGRKALIYSEGRRLLCFPGRHEESGVLQVFWGGGGKKKGKSVLSEDRDRLLKKATPGGEKKGESPHQKKVIS